MLPCITVCILDVVLTPGFTLCYRVLPYFTVCYCVYFSHCFNSWVHPALLCATLCYRVLSCFTVCYCVDFSRCFNPWVNSVLLRVTVCYCVSLCVTVFYCLYFSHSGRTFHGRSADQVGVWEVEGCFQAEVGLQNLPHLFAHVEEQPSALQGHLAFLRQLWERSIADQTWWTPTHVRKQLARLAGFLPFSPSQNRALNRPMFATTI